MPSETIAGHWIHTELSVALVCDDQGTPLHLIGQVVDLSERRALERELRTAAVQDPLIGSRDKRLSEGWRWISSNLPTPCSGRDVGGSVGER